MPLLTAPGPPPRTRRVSEGVWRVKISWNALGSAVSLHCAQTTSCFMAPCVWTRCLHGLGATFSSQNRKFRALDTGVSALQVGTGRCGRDFSQRLQGASDRAPVAPGGLWSLEGPQHLFRTWHGGLPRAGTEWTGGLQEGSPAAGGLSRRGQACREGRAEWLGSRGRDTQRGDSRRCVGFLEEPAAPQCGAGDTSDLP